MLKLVLPIPPCPPSSTGKLMNKFFLQRDAWEKVQMWGGCGEGSCLRGWRVQWQLKGEEREAVAGNNANLLINLASHSQPERPLRKFVMVH